MIDVAHVIGIFSPEHGGPVVSLTNYVLGQVRAGCHVRVRTLEGYPGTSPAVRLPSTIDQQVFPVGWPAKLGRSSELSRFLREESSPDIYHVHGAWLRAMYYGYREAKRRGRPYIVQINGAYQLYELRRKPWRKRISRLWFQDRLLHEASCLHVNSVREAREIRSLGFKGPMVVIPAGFDLEGAERSAQRIANTQPWSDLAPQSYFLYLARIHPNKGIELLLETWRLLCDKFPGIKLLVIGTGEPAYLEKFRQIINDAGLSGRCVWKGFVSEDQKAWCFQNARFYCLPSFTENFGNTVQEALGFGTPVLTTTETPWSELPAVGCGWLADCNLESLEVQLNKALSLSQQALVEKGRKGKDYIRREYSLDSVIEKQMLTYRWLLGGPRPDAIVYQELS